MPCFKGIAVSIHAEGAPLPEYSMQRHSRMSRVNTYVPVPAPKIPGNPETGRAEQSKFAISITLLVPGSTVPYSTPRPTATSPYPQPQIVGGLPSSNGERGNYRGSIAPYHPLTNSDNETIAAYIYFDGRAKEEVATLLRPGEETWVNSRWVQVPDSEGGGLAEREFLFREVGLERWLNGLDLDGQDAAAKLEKRRQKMEKRRRRRKDKEAVDSLAGIMAGSSKTSDPTPEVLRYGGNESAPVEEMSEDEEDISGSDSDDEPPESAGQIKVCMFRVLASGEIKKGEYFPQFDAHDDDDVEGSGSANGKGEADHTTSFAPPKELDAKSISTQTVTGIDGPDKPYATFTFMYRGERTLRKMGVLNDNKPQTPAAAKRKSTQIDFGKLGPLKPGGTVGFSSFRDQDAKSKPRKKSNGSVGANFESDDDDDDDDDDDFLITGKMEDLDEREPKSTPAPSDAQFSGELADGVRQIKLKRQHSVEDVGSSSALKSPALGKSPGLLPTDLSTSAPSNLQLQNKVFGLPDLPDDTASSSPFKKHRGSTYDDEASKAELAVSLPKINDVLGITQPGVLFSQSPTPSSTTPTTKNEETARMEEEEL